jgi:virginiamycin A acetyltransferase
MKKTVGRYTYGHNNILFHGDGHYATANFSIGSFCSIAAGCQVFLAAYHRSDWFTSYPFGHIHRDVFNRTEGRDAVISRGDVNIGHDVWIGLNVTIMGGVTIGDGVVIAANSHVVKDIPSYVIAGGNPAKVIKNRFDEETTDILKNLKWWNWSEQKINDNIKILCSNDKEKLKSLL